VNRARRGDRLYHRRRPHRHRARLHDMQASATRPAP